MVQFLVPKFVQSGTGKIGVISQMSSRFPRAQSVSNPHTHLTSSAKRTRKTPDAKIRYERNSILEDWSARFLLVGLLLEIIILLGFSKGKSHLEIKLEAIAYVMVFGGVFGEIYFASKAKSADAELKRESDKQVAELNRLAAEANLKAETERVERLKLDLKLLEAERRNVLINQSNLVVSERLAAAQGLLTPEKMSNAARALQIIPKVAAFAGTRFDPLATSSDDGLSAFLLMLTHGLKGAGWIQTDQRNRDTILGEQSCAGGPPFVQIHLDAIRDSRLLDAANVLASALNAENIAAKVIETEIAIASENTIRILVGPIQSQDTATHPRTR
jgi:hypothetical protein